MNHLPDLNWSGYFRKVPPKLADHIREYVTHCSRSWREENYIQRTRSLLSALSVFFRSVQVTCVEELIPKTWFAYVEARLREGIKPSSLNTTLRIIQSFLRHVKDNNVPIREIMLQIRPLKTGQPLPRDLTVNQAKILLQNISSPMDRGWILLMLHGGLRTCEVRALHWNDIDLKSKTIRIHESKGLQSRVVFLSPQATNALNDLSRNSEHAFTYHDQPLSRRYCQSRLTTICKQCGFHITPH